MDRPTLDGRARSAQNLGAVHLGAIHLGAIRPGIARFDTIDADSDDMRRLIARQWPDLH
jgi:hypothetical protein